MGTWDAARAHQALEDQVDLIRFWRSREGVLFGDAFAADEGQKYGGLAEFKDGMVARACADMLDAAETVWIAPDMHDLIMGLSASAGLPNVLEEHDLLFRAGFAVLPSPMFLADVRGDTVSVGALGWERTTVARTEEDGTQTLVPGLMVCLYSVPNDPRDESAAPIRDRMKAVGLPMPRYLLLSVMGAMIGEPIQLGEGNAKVHDPGRYLVAMMLIAQQRIAGLSGVRPYRALAKRAMKARLRADLPEIRVIDLRRQSMPPREADEEVDGPLWSHRWVVDGHWRHQWYPSENLHRWIWIAPYVKGPDGMPLIVKDKIHRIIR